MPQKEKQNIIEPAHVKPITTGKHFMQYLNKVEDHLEYCSDSENRDYVQKLETDLEEIGSLLEKVGIIFRMIFLCFSIFILGHPVYYIILRYLGKSRKDLP